jgi:excisionase family DNA binding protein
MSNSKPAYRSSAPAAVRTAAPEFVSKEIAAERLGLSVRRVLELSASGVLKRRQVLDPVTKRRQTVFASADVHRAVMDGKQRLVAYRGGAGEVAALPPVQEISAPSPDRPWLTVDEAAGYSGLPASFLLGMIEERRLGALDVGVRPGGRYRVSRRDVDAIKAPAPRK